ATTTLYHRWRSAGFNYNRGRANMISRAFLCHDYLTSDIVVDTSIDLSDPDVVANAVVQNKSCAGCHHTLDPLASYLFPMRPQLHGEFVAAGYNAKQLAKAVVLSNEFRVSHSDDVARAETVVGTLKARPEQLARMLADLTGLDWRFNSNALLRGIRYGSTNLL